MKSKDRRECVDCLQHQTAKVTVEGNSLGENPECLQSCIEAPGLLELAISLQFLQDGSTGHTSQLLTTQELGKRRFWDSVTFTNRYKPSCIRIEPEVEMAPLWIPTQGTTNYISFHWAIGCLEQGFQGTKAFYWTRRVACLRTPTDAVVRVMLSSGTQRTTLSGFITCINIRNWVGIAFCEDRKNPNISEFQALIYTKQVGISVTITPNK